MINKVRLLTQSALLGSVRPRGSAVNSSNPRYLSEKNFALNHVTFAGKRSPDDRTRKSMTKEAEQEEEEEEEGRRGIRRGGKSNEMTGNRNKWDLGI